MIEVKRTDRIAYVDGKPVRLSKNEYDLLVAFGMVGSRVVPADMLMDLAMSHAMRVPEDRDNLNTRISRLRQKLERPFVESVPGIGYRLAEPVEFTDA